MPSLPVSNELQFLREFLARPLKVASPVPSGRTLARKIAEQIDPEPGGLVVELGPGTGAVTRAIRERGIPDCDLIAIESEPRFVALLRAQIPELRIVEGDAFRFRDILGDRARDLRSIVCGLPVVGRPAGLRHKLLGDAMSTLRPGAPFIQFSYSIGPPLPVGDTAKAKRVTTVWQNVPPMHIWVYRSIR
jgi:phosphatidylethanolamine/phosphatidyl-N-methylethanolamine N-methyltransferase